MSHATLANISERYVEARYRVFQYRCEASIAQKLLFALGMACVVGLLAQVRVPLPWSPVPLTGQTFAALMAGVLLGRWWGGASMALYVGLGVAGVPWFSGWGAGAGFLVGPTGGYIIGFILAALFVGHFTDKYVRARSFVSMLALMLFANFVFIHGIGLLVLGLYLNLVPGLGYSISQLLWMGTIPFIAGDIIKAVSAAALARGITPKQTYNDEKDGAKWKTWPLP